MLRSSRGWKRALKLGSVDADSNPDSKEGQDTVVNVILAAQQANPVASMFGIAYLGMFALAVVVWFQALSTRNETWTAAGQKKSSFFLCWYLGGFVTMGLVPMGMSIWYLTTLAPKFKEVQEVVQRSVTQTPATASTMVGHGGRLPERPAAWYADPQGVKRLRYWDGDAWTDHLAD